ncbi:MAG: class I SAM-dependent methyltransferase [Nostocoides sp.]
MDSAEIRRLVALEDAHWWYRERRHLLDRMIAGLTPSKAVDVGAAGGGNTRVLRARGWDVVAVEYGQDGAQFAQARGVATVRGDATALPLADGAVDLLVAFDVLEHIVDHDAAVAEARRVLAPGGRALIAVPTDPALWSEHDVAVGHVRRYTAPGLLGLLERGGFTIESAQSWMVLLKPVVALRRRSHVGSDLVDSHRLVNAGLGAVVALERYLPVQQLPGVSLLVTARR